MIQSKTFNVGDEFLSQYVPLEKPVKIKDGDILIANLCHLGDIYNVYVMEKDLPELLTYNDLTNYLKILNNKNNKNWEIPSLILLKIMYKMKDKIGNIKNINSGSDDALWYWSCTEPRDYPDDVLVVRFSDGDDYWNGKDYHRLSCRPCRVELII